MVLGLFTIEEYSVLHQEFIKSQQKNDDDANWKVKSQVQLFE
jgi:hypothetical protein